MIGVVCPTKRPGEFLKLARSVKELSTQATLLAYVDDEDWETYSHLEDVPGDAVRWLKGPRCGPTAAVNKLVEAFPGYDIYGVCPDDCAFSSPAWDVFVGKAISEFPNQIGVFSPAHNFGPFVNFPFVSRRWIDVLGWFAFPKMYHFCWDSVLELLGEQTAIRFATPDEMFMTNQAIPAFNYATHFQADCEQFLWWTVLSRKTHVEKLKAAM